MPDDLNDGIIQVIRKAVAEGVPVEPIKQFVDGYKAKSFQAQASRAPWENYTPESGVGTSMFVGIGAGTEVEVPAWSYYPTRRDSVLRSLWKQEPFMAGAVYSLSARVSSLAYDIRRTSGVSQRKEQYFRNLVEQSDYGRGFTSLRKKLAVDLLTQDNGVFLELVGAGNPAKAMVGLPVQINHLDSLLCWRTFDPEYPVIYINPYKNTYHKIHRTRIVSASSMTQPDEMARGIGFCAVSRALRNIQYLRDVGIYKHEKVAGRFTRAIGWGTGFTDKQLEQSIEAVDMKRNQRNFAMYKGIPFVLSPRDNASLSLLDLAKLPDGFDFEKETNILVYAYAMAFGVDARELWPSTIAGATKADASVQHLKARGKGYADLLGTIEELFNIGIFGHDSGVKLLFDYTDDEQDLLMARIHSAQVDMLVKLVERNIIDNYEARDIAVSLGVLDKMHLHEKPLLNQNVPSETEFTTSKPPDLQDHTGPRDTLNPIERKAIGIDGVELGDLDDEIELPEFTESEILEAYALYKRLLG